MSNVNAIFNACLEFPGEPLHWTSQQGPKEYASAMLPSRLSTSFFSDSFSSSSSWICSSALISSSNLSCFQTNPRDPLDQPLPLNPFPLPLPNGPSPYLSLRNFQIYCTEPRRSQAPIPPNFIKLTSSSDLPFPQDPLPLPLPNGVKGPRRSSGGGGGGGGCLGLSLKVQRATMVTEKPSLYDYLFSSLRRSKSSLLSRCRSRSRFSSGTLSSTSTLFRSDLCSPLRSSLGLISLSFRWR